MAAPLRPVSGVIPGLHTGRLPVFQPFVARPAPGGSHERHQGAVETCQCVCAEGTQELK